MKLLSDASEYALRAAVWLGQHPGETLKVREIAEGTQAPPGYLIKVLQGLAKAGILSAQRGTLGGFTLRRNPADLTVLEIINAIDPIERIHSCPLGIESHGPHLCPLHRRMDDAMLQIEQSFATLSIAQLINEPSRSRPLCPTLYTEPAAPAGGKGDEHER